MKQNQPRGNPKALLPIGVFLVLYLGLGILFEYGMQIPMGFYNIPIVVAFLVALLVACLQNRKLSLDDKLVLMGQGVGDKNIIIMILIFMTAGIFVGVVGRSSADSVAYFLLSLIPAQFAVAVLFVVACFVSLAIIHFLSFGQDTGQAVVEKYNLIQIIPYLLVLIGGIVGGNVFVVLLIGIVSGSLIMLLTGATPATELLANMGSGAAGMFETTMVAILVSAICALIRVYGGFDALLYGIKKIFKGKKGGQLGMGLLVGAMDVATANNTVAIVMANPIAKEMAVDYGISPRKTASLLDTFSCVFQGIIPYGAQMLVALSAAHELGYELSAFQVIPNLFYPFLLLVSSLLFIFVIPERKIDRM